MIRKIGKALIGAGLVLLLFVVYQLVGTNFITKQHQKALAAEVARAALPGARVPRPDLGQGVARIEIPKLGLEWVVVEGVSVEALKKGPGHYPGTAYPGETGNVVISGHRTTYGAPFFRLDEVRGGDVIRLSTPAKVFFYEVIETKVVKPTDVSVVVASEEARLTLTTCTPRFSAAKRLIVVARLIEDAAGAEAA